MNLLGGRYRITAPLGAGGMGAVFLALDTRLERRVAIKLLPADSRNDAVARERLRREALDFGLAKQLPPPARESCRKISGWRLVGNMKTSGNQHSLAHLAVTMVTSSDGSLRNQVGASGPGE